jgi:predicted nucleic acid-binding protein
LIHGIDTTFLVQADVQSHPGHVTARTMLDRLLAAGDTFALAPQVLAEFIHVVTDPRRFERPLALSQAHDRADTWWHAKEVISAFPGEHTVPKFIGWLREHRLGRQRLLDTLLAATYFTCDVRSIVSTNARDFKVFGVFDVIEANSE